MLDRRRGIWLAVLLLSGLLIFFARQIFSDSQKMDKIIFIALGQKGADIVEKSPVPILSSGVSSALMYEVGTHVNGISPIVELQGEAGEPAIRFPVADSLDFYDDAQDNLGVGHIELSLKGPDRPPADADTAALLAYDDAVRQTVQNTIDRINAAGWRRWIRYSSPRLAGRDSVQFEPASQRPRYDEVAHSMAGIDPAYALTSEDWRQLAPKVHRWLWIKDGKSIEIRYDISGREDNRRAAYEPLTVTIRSAWSTLGASYSAPKQGESQAQSQQRQLERMLARRAERETAARAAQMQIQTDYQDPVIGEIRLPGPAR